MKRLLHKSLAVLLALVMFSSMLIPALAYVDPNQTRSQVPIIRIKGDGNVIYDKDGNALSMFSKLVDNNGNKQDGTLDRSELFKSVANVLMPFLIQGLAFNDWEPYYENLQKEMSELFGDILLDENGEASNGSYPNGLDKNEANKKVDKKGSKGYYNTYDYEFFYDWRLDPCKIAVQLKDYIDCIKKATGAEKVALYGSCLGTNVVFAYIEKYGLDDIYGVGIDSSVSMGIEPISEALSGKFSIDGSATARVIGELGQDSNLGISDFLIATIDLAEKSGALDVLGGVAKETIYNKLVKGVTSALALGTVVYFPCYWACVSVEDFDEAIDYVFGQPGSEKQKKYAGLIEKITNYNESVKKHIPEMMAELGARDDIRLAVFVKYGYQMLPICESRDKVADTVVSAEKASFGATTGTIYEPLSDKYIAAQTEKGLGKYISPDKQIDASTCICPDYTWFSKNILHTLLPTQEERLVTAVITSERKLTVDDFAIGQFFIMEGGLNNGYFVPMTEENCHTESWTANKKEDHPTNMFERLWTFLKSLFNWLPKFFGFISGKLGTAN